MTAAAPATPDIASQSRQQAAVPLGAKLAYAIPGLPLQVLHFTALAIIPTFYARHTAVSVTAIGVTLLATRIFDAVFHPLIGFLSDRLILATGGRKPWIVVGSLLAAISAYGILTPAPTSGVEYFAFWTVMLFSSWTILEIPHRAWGSELTRDYFERSRVFALAAQVRLFGLILLLGAPFLPFFASTDVTRPKFLAAAALALALILPLSAIIAVVGAPSGKIIAANVSTLRGLIRSLRRNRPFWIFAGVFALSGIGAGLYNSVMLLYMSSYLKLGDKYPYLGLLFYVVALPMMSVWRLVANRIGKHRAWALGLGAYALVMPVYWFVPPGEASFPILLALSVVVAIAVSCEYLIPIAALGDIVDYDILKTNVNRSGNYFSVVAFVQSAQVGIGGGLGFLILGLFHFNAKGSNTALAIFGLKMTLMIIPAALYLISALLILRSPITARRHDIIRRRIMSRAERQSRPVS